MEDHREIGGVLGLLATKKVWQRRKNLMWHHLLFYLSSIGIKMLLIYNIEKKVVLLCTNNFKTCLYWHYFENTHELI